MTFNVTFDTRCMYIYLYYTGIYSRRRFTDSDFPRRVYVLTYSRASDKSADAGCNSPHSLSVSEFAK